VAILQEQPPTPSTVIPQLRTALTRRIVVEQAKGFLRAQLDISVDEAFSLLRRYAHAHGEHLTEVAQKLMGEPSSRAALVERMTELAHR
jgi:AmiR/NasT family two-component response regulator